jgi:DNA-directed RNA polymerase specialized sigma24 family protein
VECRIFGGLEVEETASELGIATATVKRDFRVARAFLADRLG